MKYATCHPDRQRFARGLCNACWQRERYHQNPEPKKAKRRAYYEAHRASEQEKASARYHKAHPEARRYGPISCAYGSGLRKKTKRPYVYRARPGRTGPRRVRVTTDIDSENYERPPAPAVIAGNDKDWWKMTEKERAHFR